MNWKLFTKCLLGIWLSLILIVCLVLFTPITLVLMGFALLIGFFIQVAKVIGSTI